MLLYNGAMLAALDVHYLPRHAFAACVLFHAFTDAHETDTRVVRVADIAPYEPGAFYKRELPCLLAVLNTVSGLEVIVIDGYVWLSADGKPGLGARLFEALNSRVAVVGVAKNAFAGASNGDPRAARQDQGAALRNGGGHRCEGCGDPCGGHARRAPNPDAAQAGRSVVPRRRVTTRTAKARHSVRLSVHLVIRKGRSSGWSCDERRSRTITPA
jgi:deoxyinosine 3'endonuclease (endonuclease V)